MRACAYRLVLLGNDRGRRPDQRALGSGGAITASAAPGFSKLGWRSVELHPGGRFGIPPSTPAHQAIAPHSSPSRTCQRLVGHRAVYDRQRQLRRLDPAILRLLIIEAKTRDLAGIAPRSARPRRLHAGAFFPARAARIPCMLRQISLHNPDTLGQCSQETRVFLDACKLTAHRDRPKTPKIVPARIKPAGNFAGYRLARDCAHHHTAFLGPHARIIASAGLAVLKRLLQELLLEQRMVLPAVNHDVLAHDEAR